MSLEKKTLSRNDLLLYLHSSAAFQILNAGVSLDVFEALIEKPYSDLEEITKRCNLERQALRTLLFGLVSLGLVVKRNETYGNAEVIENVFKANEWNLLKSWILIQTHIMCLGQLDYVESLRQNRNVGLERFPGNGKTIYERLSGNAELRRVFYDFMEAFSDYARPCLLENVSFSKDCSILDVGGGAGANSIAIAEHYPGVKVTLTDLPMVERLAQQNIRRVGLQSRIGFRAADIFKDKFLKGYDSVLFIHQLVIWNLKEVEKLLMKAFLALKPGGRVVIFSSISEDNENGPIMAALDTVYFRAIAGGQGMIYPWKDYEKILKKVGFGNIEKIRCSTWTPHGIIIGYRNT